MEDEPIVGNFGILKSRKFYLRYVCAYAFQMMCIQGYRPRWDFTWVGLITSWTWSFLWETSFIWKWDCNLRTISSKTIIYFRYSVPNVFAQWEMRKCPIIWQTRRRLCSKMRWRTSLKDVLFSSFYFNW